MPRSNFDTFGMSFITVFQILIGESWNLIFYDCWRGKGHVLASIYFVTLIFFGNIIMMNLFLAMLLGNFERASLQCKVREQEEKLKVLMPTTTQSNNPAVPDDQAEEIERPHSILKSPTDFSKTKGGKLMTH